MTLTPEQQAVNKEVEFLLEALILGAFRFDDTLNHDDLQARIDAAIAEAERMQTPWFAHEYIMDTCAEEITAMAQANAESSIGGRNRHDHMRQ